MEIRKGEYKCSNDICNETFTWVLQRIVVNNQNDKNFIVNKIYNPIENEAKVDSKNLRFICPKCGTVHYLKEEEIKDSIQFTGK